MTKLHTKNSKTAKKLSLKRQAQFFGLLADLLSSGFSLKQSLENMLTLFPATLDLTNDVLKSLNQGQNLSQALAKYISPGIYYQLKIAEKHGNLERSLRNLGNLQQRFVEQREKIMGLLFYPVLLLVLLSFLGIAIKVWLAPSMQSFVSYNQIKQPNTWQQGGVKVILGLLAALLGVLLGKTLWWWKKQGALTRQTCYSKIPIFGKVYRQYSYYNLMFNLGMLLKSGLELSDVCRFLCEFPKKSLFYQFGKQLRQQLQTGSKWESIVAKYPFIPPELALYLQKGISRDELSDEIIFFAELSYKRLLRLVDQIISWVQPLLFLVIAGIIIGMYLSILLPMYAQIGGMYQ